MSLSVVPVRIREARAFIDQHHRHHRSPRGAFFAIGAAQANVIVGVALVGRPVARRLQDGWTAEVLRVATDGTPNACSCLYGAAWRVARELGYRRLVTYILQSEPGTSLRASGWRNVGLRGGGSWDRKERPRVDMHPTQRKLRFEVVTP